MEAWFKFSFILLVGLAAPGAATPEDRTPRQAFPPSANYAKAIDYFSNRQTFSFPAPSAQFRSPLAFPPHTPSSHLTPFSIFAQTSPTLKPLRPTAPSRHLATGVKNYFSLGQESPRAPSITQLQPLSIHSVPSPLQSAKGFNSLEFDFNQKLDDDDDDDRACGPYETCVPHAICAPSYEEVAARRGYGGKCGLHGEAPGLCCPPPSPPKGPGQGLFRPPRLRPPVPAFTTYQLNEAAKHGLWEVAERDALEQTLQSRNIVVSNRRTPEYRHLQFFKTSPRAMRLGRAAITVERSSNFIMTRYELTPQQAGFGLRQFSVRDTILRDSCPEEPSCGAREEYYRTIDGSCNNLRNPTWGQAKTGFERILPPQYEDGVYAPRGGQAGSRLPSARVVSISNVADVDRPDSELTLAVMQWGQFVDHDLTHVPIFRFGNESGIECCNDEGGFVDASFNHPSCLPIAIPADDPFFRRFGRQCMNFVRSMPTQSDGCSFGFAEQMNQITHYLDGSNVYGSSGEEEEAIRAGVGGLLNVQGRALLPPDTNAEEDSCDATQQGFQCFLAGDNRVNEQPDLAVFHTIWMREHNRLALQLAKINPHWDDETLYQEARRIVVAQMQHIVYNEWLPIVLGKDCMRDNDILPSTSGYSDDYDASLNAAIRNEFATVAFRFGHTLVQGMLHLFGKNHRQTENLSLHEHFNNPRLLYTPGKLDEFLRGLSKQPMQRYDNFVTSELTNRLFQGTDMAFGMDLVALNIQRGRDHGIPPYNDLRAACGLPRARSFQDLLDVLTPAAVERFQAVYASVDDIDAFVAGISEAPVPGALLGPTFKCIIADQFTRLRKGDRFYYEHGGMISSFTEGQLQEIRKTSWARIMCDNGDHIKHVQPLAMRTVSKLNPKVSCDSPTIPKLDLTPWISLAKK